MEAAGPIVDFLIALIVTSVLGGLYFWGTRKSEPRKGLVWILLVILLATWAGGIWLRPFGPLFLGTPWLAFITVGIIVVLLFLISHTEMFRRGPRGRRDTLDMLERIEEDKAMKKAAHLSLGVLFWFLLAVLIAAIMLRYLAA